ncbi:MAG: hypothetical protein CME06_16470 [Gemmatimonadetes bacterium]|nr:hypothetical protein [Gemmatimonadota bacterium]
MDSIKPARVRALGVAVALCGAYALSRVPVFTAGYGGDGDYWNVASVARRILESGEYEMARAPGNPLHEAQMAVALWIADAAGVSGWWVANSFTLLWGVLLLLAVDRIRARIGSLRAHRWPLLAMVAFLPIFWAHSADGSDHVPAAALTLASIACALPAESAAAALLSGVLLGFAGGFRIGSLVFAPAAILALPTRWRSWRWLALSLGVALVLALVYLPVLHSQGISALSPTHRAHSILGRLARTAYRIDAALLPGFLLPFAVFLIGRSRRARHGIVRLFRRPKPAEISLLSGLLASILLFSWLPLDAAYLLPGAISVFLLATRIVRPRVLAACACVAALSAWFEPNLVDPRTGRLAPGIYPGRVSAFVHEGRMFKDYTAFLLSRRFPPGSLVVVSRAPWGGRGEEFVLRVPAESPLRAEDASPIRTHPELNDVWFVGYRPLLHGESRRALALSNRRLLIDADAIDRARQEAHGDLLAAVSSWPRSVEVFSPE